MKCLIIESFTYETGFQMEQLQIPLKIAKTFFGPGRNELHCIGNIFSDPLTPQPSERKAFTISRIYPNRTRRINGLIEINNMSNQFIFIEETNIPNEYNIWSQDDKTIIAAFYRGWKQAKRSQHGRGRLVKIVIAPVSRNIIDFNIR